MKKSILLTSAMAIACSFANAQSVNNVQKVQLSKVDMTKSLRVLDNAAVATDKKQANGPKRSVLNGVKYIRPQGSYWFGMNNEGGAYKSSIVAVLPVEDICYTNVSTETGTKWYMKSQGGYEDASDYADNDNNFHGSYPATYPTSDGSISLFYPPMLSTADQKKQFVLGEWNEEGGYVATSQFGALTHYDMNADAYGFANNGFGHDNFIIGTGEWALKPGFVNTGLMDFYPAPMSPLYIDDTHVLLYSSTKTPVPAGKELTLTFYGIKSDGDKTGVDYKNVIGTMTATAEDVQIVHSTTSDNTHNKQLYMSMITFTSKGTNSLGQATSEPVIIDEPYVITMTGLEQEGMDFGLVGYEQIADDITYGDEGFPGHTTFFMLYNPSTDEQSINTYKGNLAVAYHFNGVMDYFEPRSEAYMTDGSKVEDLNVLRVGADGTVTNEGLPSLNGVPVYSALPWLDEAETENYSCPKAEWITSITPIYDESGQLYLTFECEPLPAGVDGRGAKLYVYGRGYTSSTPIYVLQGNATKDDAVAGINGVETINTTTNGRMFNLAGQQVGKDFKGIVVKDGKKMIKK